MKVGIIGIGFMGWIHWLAYQRVTNATVSAICSRDEKKRSGDWSNIKGNFGPPGEQVDLSNVAPFESFEEMLKSDIDLVDICSPPHLHVEHCVAAMDAGKHVFCEKPLALNAKDCETIVAAAETNKVQLFVGHVLPFFPEYEYARSVIDSGKYGAIIGGSFKRIISDPTWISDFYDLNKVGGPMIDLHVHDAHLIRMLFGMPEQVCSFGRMRGEAVEFCNSVFDFGDANYSVASTCGVINQQGRPFTHGFEIHLEQATMNFEFAAFSDAAESLPFKILTSDGEVIRPELNAGDDIAGFESEIKEVMSSLASGTDSKVLGGELAKDAIILAEKQTESVGVGKPIAI